MSFGPFRISCVSRQISNITAVCVCVCTYGECMEKRGRVVWAPAFLTLCSNGVLVKDGVNVLPVCCVQESEQARTDYFIRTLTVENENVSLLTL